MQMYHYCYTLLGKIINITHYLSILKLKELHTVTKSMENFGIWAKRVSILKSR